MTVEDECLSLANEVNEAIQTSYKSENPEDKREHFFLAIRKLNELKDKVSELPGGYITGLEKFENTLEEIESEYFEQGVFTKNMQSGWIYQAILKLDTPLSALLTHGEYKSMHESLDVVTNDSRYGGWWPKNASFKEMGMDFAELKNTFMSSIVGPLPLDGGDFLDYLIGLRKIVESNLEIEQKIQLLKECLSKQNYYHLNKKLGGEDYVIKVLIKSIKN